jgi:putative flippase GtrA
MSNIRDFTHKKTFDWWLRRARLAAQYIKFSMVGGAATATHALVFVILIEAFALPPLLANVFAFSIAIVVSFKGHFHWTFRSEASMHIASVCQTYTAFAKFVLVAFLGLTLNSLAVYLVIEVLILPYLYAVVPMVSLVPVITFTLSKYWVYAARGT